VTQASVRAVCSTLALLGGRGGCSKARYCFCLASIIATIGLGSAGCQLL
jgi:hypothetical protein